MISECLMPQLQEDKDDFVRVQDGAPPHKLHDVKAFLDENLSYSTGLTVQLTSTTQNGDDLHAALI